MSISIDEIRKKNNLGNYSLGKLFLDFMRSKPENDTFHVDAATGESENYGSVLSRSIRLARCLRSCFRPGDVLALAGKNHLDLHIPYYAALLNGYPIVGVDPLFKYDEIKSLLKITEPKVVFCQDESRDLFERAASELGLELKVITFDGDDNMKQLIETCKDIAVEDFQVSEFDIDNVYAWLCSTSGTSGVLKFAAFKHQILIDKIISYMSVGNMGDGTKMALHMSPIQWLSAYFNAIGIPTSGHIKLQTSTPNDLNHVVDLINKYKPVSMSSSPSQLIQLMKKECDLTCFNFVVVTGAKIFKEALIELKSRLRPDAILIEAYGQTENVGPALKPDPFGPLGSCGVPAPNVLIKLVDPETGKEITEPNVTGELWTKGKGFTEYYHNPEETARSFSPDGWYMTGDLLYHDETNHYYFVDRFKMLIKYKNFHIVPVDLEELIARHPGVEEVAVTGIRHPEDGEHPIACVVRRPGSDVTEDDIKELVAEKMSDSKRLRGGVIFMDELPKTSTGKPANAKLNQLVNQLKQVNNH